MTLPDVRSYLVGGTVWALVARVSGMIASLGVSVALAHLLDPVQVGHYFLVFTVVSGAVLVSGLGLPQVVGRLVAEARSAGSPSRAHQAAVGALLLTAGATLAVALALGLGLFDWISQSVFDAPELKGLGMLVAVLVVASTLESLFAETHRAFLRISRASWVQAPMANLLLLTALVGAAISGGEVSLRQALVVTVLAHASAVLMFYRGSLGSGGRSARFDVFPVAELLRPGRAMVIFGLASFLAVQGPLWILGALLPPSDVAQYAVALRLSMFVGFPMIVVASVIPPAIVALWKASDFDRLERVARGTTMAATVGSLPIFVALAIGAVPILQGIFGDDYREAAPLLVVLGGAQLIGVLLGPAGLILIMTGHEGAYASVTSAGAFVMLVVGHLATERFGLYGMAVASGGVLVAINVAAALAAHRLTGFWVFASFGALRDFGSLLKSVVPHRRL